MGDFVRLKNFPDQLSADQARQILAQEGIPSYLTLPEGFVSGVSELPMGGYGSPQGVWLSVAEENVERARRLVVDIFDGM